MRAITAESLVRHNLAYREPAVYDELLGDSSVTDDIIDFVDRSDDNVRTVLDLGCGTGRILAGLHARRSWDGTGIDLQPDLLTYARGNHPELLLAAGDIRTARLNATYDLIVCLGNTLSYLHTDTELAAAFATITAHSHPGTLLAIATLTGYGSDASGASEIHTTALGDATVEAASVWDSNTRILTSHRTWQFRTGRVEHDHIQRRFWERETLTDQGNRAGFDDVTPEGGSSLTLCAVRRE